MSLASKYLPRYNYQDYERWEGDWELIEGIPFAMSPAPNLRHQIIGGEIYSAIKLSLSECSKCKVIYEVDWKINIETVVKPDLLITCKKISGNHISSAPKLIVEILSPSTAIKDRNLKYELYESQGVKYYLIVDPEGEQIEVYELKNKVYKKQAEFKNEDFTFDLGKCKTKVSFENIWS